MAGLSLLGKNPELPYDIQTEQAQLAIQQLIAMELLKQSLAPVPPAIEVGGMGVSNWGNIMASGLKGQSARDQLDYIGGRQGQLAGQYNDLLREAMTRYTAQRTGQMPTPGTPGSPAIPEIPGVPNTLAAGATPETPETAGPYGQAGMPATPGMPGTPGIRPDLVGAIKYAAGSRLPALQAIAAADIKELPGGKDMLQYMKDYAVSGRNPFLATGDPSYLRGMPEYHEAGNVQTVTQEGFPIWKGANQEYSPTAIQQDTGLPTQTTKYGGQEVPLTPNFPTNVGGPVAEKQILESYKSAGLAIEANASINAIEAEIKKIPPEAFGAGSNLKLFVDRWVETLGGQPVDWTQGTEYVKGQLDNLMASKIRQFAPVADKDVDIARGMIGRDFTLGGMKKMLAFLRERNDVALANHQNQLEGYLKIMSPVQREGLRQMLSPLQNVPTGEEPKSVSWAGTPNSRWAGMTAEELTAEYKKQQAADAARKRRQ